VQLKHKNHNIIVKLFTLMILFFVFTINAQTSLTNEQLALQYFDNKEYDKAVVYYEKLYDKQPSIYYLNYINCLIKTDDKKKAEKTIKKQIKSNPFALNLYVDLGDLYNLDNDTKKSEEQYLKAIKELNGEYEQTLILAEAFKKSKLFDYAIQAFEKSAKLNNQTYPFYYEKADVYKDKGDLKAMINQYLDAVIYRESEFINVQNELQSNLGYDDEKGGFNNPILKQELQKRIQQNPSKTILTEFLIFIQLQQKDFDGAFIQNKALDKRNREDGYRLMDLAKICVTNENYEVAEKCFSYVLEKGKENYNYTQATIDGALAQFDKLIKQNLKFTNEQIVALADRFKSIINEFGLNQSTIPVSRKLAYINAYYLNKLSDAIEILNEVVTAPGIDKFIQADAKLELGDATLISGNVWDASLLYSQVEKSFKYDIVGQEAKFRNAKLSFYNGDFKWSKAQLDVLKGATSKLIANDAMDLSLIIGDAINIDTNVVPLQYFASADLLLLQNKTDEALKRMDSINILFDNHSLADDIYFKKGLIYTKKGMYNEALEAYKRVVENYGDEIFGDDAFFKMAELYQFYVNDLEKAKTTYQELLTKYPGSIYTVEARKRFRKLRGDNVN
jgi:tetratricopeptide (TPR) repeat protein